MSNRVLTGLLSVIRWFVMTSYRLAAAGILFCAACIFYAVVSRYLLNRPIGWVEDAVAYTLVAIISLSAAEVFRRNEHIAVDLMTAKLGDIGNGRLRRLSGIVLFVVAGTLAWQCVEAAKFTRTIGVRIGGTLEWEIWPMILILGYGLILMMLAAISAIFGPTAPAEDVAGQ